MQYKQITYRYNEGGLLCDIQAEFIIEGQTFNAKLSNWGDLLYFGIWQGDDENDDLFSMVSDWDWADYLDDNSTEVDQPMRDYCLDRGLDRLGLKVEHINSDINFIL